MAIHNIPESRESGVSFLDLLLFTVVVVTSHDSLRDAPVVRVFFACNRDYLSYAARVRRQVVLCPPQIAPGEQTLQTAYPRDRQPRFP